MLIYKHTSKTSGKSYIGLTKNSLEDRLYNHIRNASNGSNLHFPNAIRKYGIKDFESTILEDNIKTYEEAAKREIFYIKKFNSYLNGYNMTPGGDLPGLNISKMVETRKKKDNSTGLSSFNIGAINAAKTKRERGDLKKMSDELIGIGIAPEKKTCEYCNKTVRACNYSRWHGKNCKLNPDITKQQLKKREPSNKGKPMSEEQKLKLSKAHLGKVNCYDTINKKYLSVSKEKFDSDTTLIGTTKRKVKIEYY